MNRFACLLCRTSFVWMILVAAGLTSQNVSADVVQLQDGDTFQCEVVAVTETTLTVRHKILGEMEIPRDKVTAIVLNNKRPPAIVNPASAGKQPNRADAGQAKPGENETPKQIIDRLVNKDFGPKAVEQLGKGTKRQPTPEDAVEQLRREGVDPQLTKALHMMLPGFGTPEVQGYFNDRVDGLMTGSINIQHIRSDAINARDQLKDIMDDLGQDGAALQGYYSILDNFIEKTTPNQPAGKGAPPNNAAPNRVIPRIQPAGRNLPATR